MSYSEILEINPLSTTLFANIYFNSGVYPICGFLCCAKTFQFNQIKFFIFVFISITQHNRSEKDTAVISMKEYSAYVFLLEFNRIQSYT